MYSRGILGNCFWNIFFRPVKMIIFSLELSLLTTRNSIIPSRSSVTADFSVYSISSSCSEPTVGIDSWTTVTVPLDRGGE